MVKDERSEHARHDGEEPMRSAETVEVNDWSVIPPVGWAGHERRAMGSDGERTAYLESSAIPGHIQRSTRPINLVITFAIVRSIS